MPDHTSSKSNKRKKFHDKDKYYKLAKEQGLRSRAAFKLSQINRQFPVLEKAKVVLDLCAAPGGWTQIAARTCPKTTQIIAVDILPIRAFAGHRNITTLIGDITTDKCKADIAREVKKNAPNNNNNHRGGDTSNKGLVDVVLHDGAPNIGASYDKDAYLQTEIALHALKCATHHLKRHGVFVTKLYRSRDYASYHWVMQQLFTNVHTIKPKASRSASAEIFLIGEDYLRPDTIDPKLLDPQHIFATVEGDTTVASATGAAGGLSSSFNIFHKSWDKTANRRQRDGYDLDAVDATLRRIRPISEFIQASSVPEAIQLLSTCSGFQFRCDVSPTMNEEEKKNATTCHTLCQWYLHHPFTSTEMKECATDLKVLNKADFRALLAWRDKMRQAEELVKADKKEKSKEKADEADSGDDSDDDDDKVVEKKADEDDVEKEESEVQREIAEMRARKLKERKKQKKKERALASKKRKHAALGMNLNAIDIGDSGDPLANGQVFSLATLTSKGDLDAVAEVNLDQMTDEQIFGANEDEDEELGMLLASKKDKDEETGYSFRLERELDAAYDKYLSTTKNAMAKVGTKNAKRSKKLMREKMAEESHEDHELILAGSEGVDADTKAYVKLLNKAGSDDDLDDDDSDREDRSVEDDDGFDAEPMTPQEHAKSQKSKKQKASETVKTSSKGSKKEKNPLIHEFPDQEPTSIKTARWFSNPLFAEIGKAAESATSQKKSNAEADGFSEDDDESESEADEENSGNESDEGSKPKKKRLKKSGLDADEVLAMIPKTDKQVRHERRLKSIARDERRQVRKAKQLGDTEGDFDLAPQEEENEDDDSDLEEQMAGMSEERKRKLLEARQLIKDGMGQTEDAAGTSSKIEVVPQDRPLPVMDDRKYDSEHEDYDSDDYVRTLALGTMLLRRSKAKSLVDASYNRYAWNDPGDLPEWFADDENRHYRPQLPIPAGLIAKMREKQLALSAKPIAKVAEARARKNKKAKLKLVAAKQKAQSVANSSEMSEAMKLKAISKALRSDVKKNAGKTYVVAKKGRGANGAKGVKVVDKRLKNDKRSMERSAKKKKSGKQGGLTGSKRRRHHS